MFCISDILNHIFYSTIIESQIVDPKDSLNKVPNGIRFHTLPSLEGGKKSIFRKQKTLNLSRYRVSKISVNKSFEH